MVSYGRLQVGRYVPRGVLILVVVEDGLVPKLMVANQHRITYLNPCCSGRRSSTYRSHLHKRQMLCLNPYCSGRRSSTYRSHLHKRQMLCLNPYCSGRWSRTHSPSRNGSSRSVLILIVVDDGLVLKKAVWAMFQVKSLNPYCSGRWSRTLLTANVRCSTLVS